MEHVGFIGLGIMGSRMAACVRRAGHPVLVWNRTRATAEAWAAEHGGEVADTPADVAVRCDVVVTIVVDGAQVEQVIFGPGGLAEAAREGLHCIDMSTIAPAEARALAERLAQHGARFLDAPVTGSAPKAADGTLTIMVGGEPADVERVRPVLDAMGETIVHVGPVGHGQTVKVLSNALAAANVTALAQALLIGKRAGVDLERMVEVLPRSAGGSRMVELKAQPMLDHDFAPLFKLEHMLKDAGLALDAARELGVPFPAAAQARELLSAGVGRGLGEQDFAAVVEVLESLAGLRLDD
ncbi:NAD(P)-dependent oxidoreductase [Conexibacter arvalis]|uniref:3-hydroxyisobutyrate dehydrogenase-like beta-hydroxyacid dehydrogenase n=1 Tax=Conexibacter arvalis TaxID=912552 RepID=A0A840IHR9_9ACTN|nr:NAD(P)-dependent oxidoreductase [Conexibacter arvalis]MBB4663498.1 3-hydroxyisobutyrate dehydrogenase-like beta-hydroxyacid dehydrogenase [Conexibacter arvalis]